MLAEKDLVVRASAVSYAVLWVPLAALGGLYLSLALGGQRDAGAVAGILIFIGLIGTTCLMRLRLTLTSDAIFYRGLIHTVRIPIHDIAAIHGVMIGREYSEKHMAKGPGFILIVETVPGRNSRRVSVSMKPLNKQKLREMFNTMESRGIPVRLDEVVTALFAAK